MKTVLYPGTFDPITLGHVDLVQRAGRLFDRVVVGVAASLKKQPLFDLEERCQMAREALAHIPQAVVVPFSGLTVAFAREHGALGVLRGLRTGTDFDYELQLASMNRAQSAQFETIFLTPTEGLSYISSTLVREIASMGGDIRAFVPTVVAAALQQRFAKE